MASKVTHLLFSRSWRQTISGRRRFVLGLYFSPSSEMVLVGEKPPVRGAVRSVTFRCFRD